MVEDFKINDQRFFASIEELSSFTEKDRPWTRRAFTPLYLQARDWLRKEFEVLGADVYLDAAANLRARFASQKPGKKTLALGSHIDTVPYGGRFDGIAGVLTGLEIARSLAERQIKLEHNWEVIDFLSEEASDYGLDCIGSRMLSAQIDESQFHYKNDAGETLEEALKRMGGDPKKARNMRCDDLLCFLEMHIEQGRVLEETNLDVGVVGTIVGITRVRVVITGQANHSGTTPMLIREDTLAAFSHFHHHCTEKVRQLAREKEEYLVFTIGKMEVKPNAANVIAGQTEFTIDLRSDSTPLRFETLAYLEKELKRICELEKVKLESWDILYNDEKTRDCEAQLQELFVQSCESQKFSYKKMASGATHDCAFMTYVCPSAILLIPSKNGISHSPDEWSSQQQLAIGCQVIADTLVAADRHFSQS